MPVVVESVGESTADDVSKSAEIISCTMTIKIIKLLPRMSLLDIARKSGLNRVKMDIKVMLRVFKIFFAQPTVVHRLEIRMKELVKYN